MATVSVRRWWHWQLAAVIVRRREPSCVCWGGVGCHFPAKNYTKYVTRRNRWQFRWNSACFAEEKNLRILFWTISWKRKTLGIPCQTIFGCYKPQISVPNQTIFGREITSEFHSEPFLDEKKPWTSVGISFWAIFSEEKYFGIPFRTNSRNRKHSKICSKQFLWTENTWKGWLLICFVKLHYFAEFHSVSLRVTIWFFRDTEWHFIPRNNENRSKSILGNFFGMEFRW